MKCSQCGAELQGNAKYCIICGVRQTLPGKEGTVAEESKSAERRNDPVEQQTGEPIGSLIGFSDKIGDPAYAKFMKNSSRWALIFTVILAFAAIVGFMVAGMMGIGGMSNPQALFIGLGIGGLFIVIALVQTLKSKKDTTWEGSVVDKAAKKKRRQRNDGEDATVEEYIEYTVTVQSDDGKKHYLRRENSKALFDYYNVGDRVKHHAGLSLYEKYDKSKDNNIFCIACGNLCSMQDNICGRCKCPLLK